MPKRYDSLTDTTVIVAEDRSSRPYDWGEDSLDKPTSPTRDSRPDCPFCRGREHRTETPRLALDAAGRRLDRKSGDWVTRVVDNKYPVARTKVADAPEPAVSTPPNASSAATRGLHEVVVATPDHQCRIAALDASGWKRMLLAWRHRLSHAQNLGLAYGAAFVNYGPQAGASLAHLHGQLLGIDETPPRAQTLIDGFNSFAPPNNSHSSPQSSSECLMCNRLRELSDRRDRLIADNDDAVAFAPFASRFPFEICVVPRRHRRTLLSGQPPASDHAISGVASMLTSSLRRLANALGDPPLNIILQNAPLDDAPERFHWHIKILPALSRGAGFEWGTGWYVNPVAPETAATTLRDAEISL